MCIRDSKKTRQRQSFVVAWSSYEVYQQPSTGFSVDYNILGQRFHADGSTSLFGSSAKAVNVTAGIDDGSVVVDSLAAASANIHQIDKIELTGTVEAGDQYTVAIDGNSVTYTAQESDTLSAVRSGLISSLNYDASLSGIVQALSLIHI